jgi:hypothetical protein
MDQSATLTVEVSTPGQTSTRSVLRKADSSWPTHGIRILSLLIIAGMSACVMSRDQAALQNASVLKTETLALVAKATESYDAHRQEVANLTARLERALDLERSRPNNTKTVQMWETLLHENPQLPGSGIFPRFVSQWESKGTLKPAYISAKTTNLAAAFEKIISLESAKPR